MKRKAYVLYSAYKIERFLSQSHRAAYTVHTLPPPKQVRSCSSYQCVYVFTYNYADCALAVAVISHCLIVVSLIVT